LRVSRQDLQGREAGRPAVRAAHAVFPGDQSQDRQGSRPHRPTRAPASSGRSDPV